MKTYRKPLGDKKKVYYYFTFFYNETIKISIVYFYLIKFTFLAFIPSYA